ncbi:MAG TPA: class I SAM-dependent methyltransferase [Alphaproteobacteria bacterium]|nr:class I SAM-dependent methyltransferase [Alphaproteobacteria bacterium]
MHSASAAGEAGERLGEAIMRLSDAAELGLGLGAADFDEAFRPFLARWAEQGDPDWRQALRERDASMRSKLLRRWLPGFKRARTDDRIRQEYDKVWSRREFEKYALDSPAKRPSPWLWNSRRCFATGIAGTRTRLLLIMQAIETLRPKTVLEVGSGNGINLILLSCRFPDIRFHGVELTAEGIQAATGFQQSVETLPEHLVAFSPLPPRDPAAFRRIEFRQGTAAALPYDAGSMDLVLTVLALEQMERIRHQALSEVARVSGGHTLRVEPFRDCNRTGRRWLNVLARNYFRARIDDLKAYGLDPVWATDAFPQEYYLGVCAVLSRKRG